MELIIEHPTYSPSKLPWDLRTIFDCTLSLDDVETLESGTVLQIGECKLRLESEGSCN